MATGKKYKIVLSEKYVRKSENGKEWFQFPLNISGQLVAIQTIIPLDPYTEPDMEQVRKEAYDKGYDDATAKIGSDERAIAEKAYQKGLSDAWEAARKVTQVRKYGGYGDCLEEVFGRHRVPWDVFDYSASEAIEKIWQYEQEKEEQIRVGDEIETPSGLKGYVVNFTDDELVHYVSSEGRFGTMGTSAVSKTGRHFPEIAEVLAKMKKS